jgi:hypothetical protein
MIMYSQIIERAKLGGYYYEAYRENRGMFIRQSNTNFFLNVKTNVDVNYPLPSNYTYSGKLWG